MSKRIFDWASPDSPGGMGFIEVAEPGDIGGGGGGGALTVVDATEFAVVAHGAIAFTLSPADPSWADYAPLGPLVVPAHTPFTVDYYLEAVSTAGAADDVNVNLLAVAGGEVAMIGTSSASLGNAFPAALNDPGAYGGSNPVVGYPVDADVYLVLSGSDSAQNPPTGVVSVRNRHLGVLLG